MTKYGINQKYLSEKIDEEFEEMREVLRILHYQGQVFKNGKKHFSGITIAVIEPVDTLRIDTFIAFLQSDVHKFKMHMPATYVKTLLQRASIPGFAICDLNDEFDPNFGELVAKARLLKYLKRSGRVIA